MSLQEKLDAYKKGVMDGSVPNPKGITPEERQVMKRATDDLIASGAADRALKVGDRAPGFSLPDPDGQTVTLADLLARGPLVLTFYRGVWCPYCNMELQALQAALPAIEAAGASLVAISPQSAANSRKSQRQNELGFPILSDRGNEVAAAFGLRFTLPEGLVAIYKRIGNLLPLVNGDESWTLPMPARYVIGQDGVIRYAEVNPDYTRRPEPEDLLPVLHGLRRERAAA